MDYIYNVTFMVAPSEEARLLGWLKAEALPRLFNSESPAHNASLRKVVEAGGERIGEEHALSIALHAEFAAESSATDWNDIYLLPVLGEFHRKFGNESAFFVTLLENLPL